MSPYGFRSSSVRIGTKLGASPMARSDAIIPMYQMIHIALLPPKGTHGAAGSRSGTVHAEGGGIAACCVRLGGKACDVTFRQRRERADSDPRPHHALTMEATAEDR